jgi:hypothetical protein
MTLARYIPVTRARARYALIQEPVMIRHEERFHADRLRALVPPRPQNVFICRHRLRLEPLISLDYFHVGVGAARMLSFALFGRRFGDPWPGRHEANAFADVCVPRHFSATSIPAHQRPSMFVIVRHRSSSCSLYLVERRDGSVLDEEV